MTERTGERDKEKVYREIGGTIRQDANGIVQMAYIGVINPLNPRVESIEEVGDALVTAAGYIPKEQLGLRTVAAFRRSASTRNRISVHRILRGISLSRKSKTASKEPGWPPKSLASLELIPLQEVGVYQRVSPGEWKE